MVRWVFASREETNFTYALDDRSRLYMVLTVSQVTGARVDKVETLFAELENDADLRAAIEEAVARSPFRAVTDPSPEYGRRLAWYATARLLKPRLVVETGIEKGLGAAVLCAALVRNAAEGSPGRYIGTDIIAEAGWMLTGQYRKVATFMIGDSIESLKALGDGIDLFINDSDHAAEYEAAEYRAVADKLSPNAIILGDNAHNTLELAAFANSTGRQFLFAQEVPAQHWYPGAGIGFGFSKAA